MSAAIRLAPWLAPDKIRIDGIERFCDTREVEHSLISGRAGGDAGGPLPLEANVLSRLRDASNALYSSLLQKSARSMTSLVVPSGSTHRQV
jgi:hypothetical protein